MKILVTASHRGKKHYDTYYKKIYDCIEQLGHTNVSDSLIKIPYTDYYETLGQKGHDGYIKDYERMLTSAKSADIVVFECSFPSLGIGFMIQKTLEMNKPVIAMYLKDNTPTFLVGLQDEKFQLVEYTEDSLKDVLKTTIEKAQGLADKRFNFFISPSLLTYLNEAAKKDGVTKSTFIRNLLLDYKRKMIRNQQED